MRQNLKAFPQRNFSLATSSSHRPSGRDCAIVQASRFVRDHDVVFVGQGLPVIAAILAKKTHAKKSVIMNEYGVVDSSPSTAVELAHPLFAESATFLCDMVDALGCLIYHIDIALMGAAQIDMFGNVNTTSIGNYRHPKLRISGSGGANDIGSLAPKFVLIMDQQNAAKFPKKVDYVTTPGFLSGKKRERENFGLSGGGPVAVVTDIGVYRFSRETGEMRLDALFEGISKEEARSKTGWNLKISGHLRVIPRPSVGEVNRLHSLDPRKVYVR